MKKTTILAAASTAVLLAGALSACSGSSSPDTGDSGGSADLRVWFMQDSVPDSAQKYLETEFAKENPGSTLTVEVQQWDGIAQKLQTSLPSSSQTPDIVETGNTQTTIFSSVGAFSDLTAQKASLGGDDLIPGAVASATWKDKLYGVPLYAGARSIYYRTDLFQKAGIEVPTTIDGFMAAVDKLQTANPDKTKDFSAIYLSANDVHSVESWLFANGGHYATEDGGTWHGDLGSTDSQRGLSQLQTIFQKDTKYALDSAVAANGQYNLFNDGKVGMINATLNIAGKISPELVSSGKVGVFPFPSNTAGEAGTTFGGGSNVSISAASTHQKAAQAALKIIMGKEFQSLLASDGGWVPGNLSYADALTGPFAKAAREAVAHSTLTPNTPQWGVAVANNMLTDFYVSIAKGTDPSAAAKKADASLDSSLNAKN